jgi:nanoRNase/pAp phosphatase (c-di-AMP/oligoRNAs hydrolase)
MRYVVVCGEEVGRALVPPSALPGKPPLFVVRQPRLRDALLRQGAEVVVGDLERETVYRRALRSGREPVLVAVPVRREAAVVKTIRRVAPAAPIFVLSENGAGSRTSGVTRIPRAAFAARIIAPAVERAATRTRVDRVRRHFAGAEHVLIMLQDDPDPDAIASALGLRVLLGRTRAGAPIATFGSIGRAENRTMARLLEIDVERITPRDVRRYDRIAMVDVQPSFFEERVFTDVDLVIDHHPDTVPVRAAIKDVRPSYGATSTIVTEYLRAADVKIPTRLATALLYGIKSDTQDLERGATRADVDAFAFLHALANHAALRRIERPELPEPAVDLLAHAISRRRIVDGAVIAHVGTVGYPELVAQFADLFLQIHGGEWSLVSGVVAGDLHISVRSLGQGRAAGDVVRRAFGALGSAGGHRSMAKAVVPLGTWRARVGPITTERVQRAIAMRFQRALRGAR